MILDVILEKILHLVRKRMVGLDLDLAQAFGDGNPILAEQPAVRNPVHVTHEASSVVGELVGAFLEFVEFLDDSHRYDNVVVLEFAYGLVIMQDDIGVQHENLGLSGAQAVGRCP